MLTQSDARNLAAQKVGATVAGPIAILDDATIEKPWGWVFFYQSRRYLESHDPSHQLAGNSPIIVTREDGQVISTGTAHPLDFYVQNFEMTGDPHERLGREFEIRPRDGSPRSVEAARVLSDETSLGVGQAKRALDAATVTSPMLGSAKSPAAAADLCETIQALGYDCQQVPESAV